MIARLCYLVARILRFLYEKHDILWINSNMEVQMSCDEFLRLFKNYKIEFEEDGTKYLVKKHLDAKFYCIADED